MLPQPAWDDRAFAIKDCTLIAIATGERASTFAELRDALARIDIDCIYYHFWGGLLKTRFEAREYANDFADWLRHSLRDTILSERIATVDPTDHPDLETLRRELIDLIDYRLDESEHLNWMRATYPFEFLRSQIVVFDTGWRITQPVELAERVPHLSAGSIFYHLIDARRRHPAGLDDFRAWLQDQDSDACQALCDDIAGLDPFFVPLTELRAGLADIFAQHRNRVEAAT